MQYIAEVLERKTGALKALEEEIVELKTNMENMSQIINESTRFEIYCKTKLSVLNKFLGKYTG